MSFYRSVIATVAALGLATSVFAADQVTTTTQNPDATTTTTTTTTTDANTTTTSTTSQINLNTATAEELAKVDGLNSKKAEMIVKYRNDNGNFTTVNDLKKVKGLHLNVKQMNRVKSQLMVS